MQYECIKFMPVTLATYRGTNACISCLDSQNKTANIKTLVPEQRTPAEHKTIMPKSPSVRVAMRVRMRQWQSKKSSAI